MASVIRGPRLVLLGRQGAGKGTQATKLVAHLGVHHLSTGAILRQEVSSGTALGRRVEELMAEATWCPTRWSSRSSNTASTTPTSSAGASCSTASLGPNRRPR